MNIISKLFKKRGIDNFTELSKDEREQYEKWQAILSRKELTIKEVKEFCGIQVDAIEAQFRDLDRSKKKTEGLVLQHSIYKTLIQVIDSPQKERETLEKYLTTLLE